MALRCEFIQWNCGSGFAYTNLALANPANFCKNNSLSYPCQKD
jgi:hypothetical protein